MATLKTLIVDDEPGIRSGIKRILRNFTVGYPFMDEDFEFDLLEAATGEEAIGILEKEKVDIVLLDNKLPGIDGMEVLEDINKKQMDVAVMMITSYASLELAIKATRNGAYNFSPKPFTPDELRASMENIAKHLFLKRMTSKMQQEGKSVRFQFLSVLSHELKSPLNAIEGYLRMMQDRQAGDKLEDYDKMVDRSLVRIKGMRNLIMDLLDLTKIESGRKKRQIKKIDLNDVAKMAVDTMEPYAIQRNVKVHLDIYKDAVIKADMEEMEIIFNNLISNAIKYNKDNGEVFIGIKPQNGDILIMVEDTGIGMSEEETASIFQEFVRIKNQKTRTITGSGLGLSIIKKIIDENGGEISVKSKPDVGSTFTVRLPKSPINI
ncbi:MAG: hybrid sensor histidine kinase/response regulator [Bacteroidota bacterium]|nr:hybrid sensor histidine kinase/response regulator [Bacteroidota bacterium]